MKESNFNYQQRTKYIKKINLLDPDIKKRKALLEEYRTALNKLKKKIEENEKL